MTEVAKTAGLQSSLLSVKKTTSLADRAQENLASGRKVNKVTDNPLAFFIAKALTDKAGTLTDLKTGVDQAVSSVTTASIGIETIEKFTQQLKGLAEAARSADPAQQKVLADQFREIGNQIALVAEDASYQGQNLLKGNNQVQARFDEREESKLTVNGYNLTGSTADLESGLFSVAAYDENGAFQLGAFGITGDSFTSFGTDQSAFNDLINNIDSAVNRLRGQAAELGSNVAILQERLNYTDNAVNNLLSGADKLTLADLNEEAATLTAADTRRQLGLGAVSLAGQQSRSILQLLGQA
ncbi:MAG: flagellin [Alphaproteobacteria bacterium]|nr:flagellin [Alphaproteobacteria bacterium]